jgi:hypothetical protein
MYAVATRLTPPDSRSRSESGIFISPQHIRKANVQITVVALMCHTLASIPQPVCREEIVVKDEMPTQACMLSQAALADWKEHSIYADEQWAIGRVKCVPGDYVIEGAI